MIKRIIDISKAAYISTKNKQLIIKIDGVVVGSVPIEDLGGVILQHPAIVITQAAILYCQEHNVVLVFCDRTYLPISILLPLCNSHSLQTKILREQILINKPTKNRIWKQIIINKIAEQISTLKSLKKNVSILNTIKNSVKNGDSTNREAHAAVVYWKILMGSTFKRRQADSGVNALLNYGYAIIRAMVARAVVGSGLHPSLGVFHNNQYNSMCLIDDIMEPLRPFVDRVVYNIYKEDTDIIINSRNKQRVLELLAMNVRYNKMIMPLMVTLPYIAANIKDAMFNKRKDIIYPSRIEQ